MALTKSTYGDKFRLDHNIVPGKLKSGYTANYGDLVIKDATGADFWDRCAAGENPGGIVVSDNNDNGTISVALFVPGVQIMLEYLGTAPAIGNRMEAGSTVGKGTVTYTDRDVVTVDAGDPAANGVGQVIAVDTTAKTVCLAFFGSGT